MWERILDSTLQRLITEGELTVTWPDGQRRGYGRPGWRSAGIALKDRRIIRELCLNPELAFGEGYMDGRIEIDTDALRDVLHILFRNRRDDAFPAWVRGLYAMHYALRGFVQRNAPGQARRNVAHHYDISDDLYRLFLDRDMQYSCAYWSRPDMTLEEAQEAKKHHIARKLLIEPGMHVLDIGCGWGGMAITLARDYGARVTGVTLSENQLATAKARVEAAGLSDRIDLRLQDYRHITESFDRIVSVGMLEHVGAPNYGTYFGKVHEMLAPHGVALIHTIGRSAPPTSHSPWLHKYIFPGGYVPSMSELSAAVESRGLWFTDVEIWRKHYALTLREWDRRFEASLDKVRKMYDERFVRMWRFYLVACEVSFIEVRQGVFQLQLARSIDAVPLTRDYIHRDDAQPVAHAAQ